MRKKLRYVRLSAEEERDLEALSEKWGCQRSEVLRFALRAFLLTCPGGSHDLRGGESEMATRQG